MSLVKARAKKSNVTTDGRALRSERSQAAIVDAMFALVTEHPAELTLETVAARAGVSVRTVFRQFRDTDSLFEALFARFGTEAIRLSSEWQPVGSLEGDLAALIDARARMFVFVEPLRRFARTARLPPRGAQDRFAEARRMARRSLRSLFAENGSAVDGDDLEALDAWISLDVWERLREQQGLSHARALRVLHATARNLARSIQAPSALAAKSRAVHGKLL